MSKEMFDRGMQIRRDMYGPERSDDELAKASDFERPLQELVTTYCFGEIWGREGLSRKTRSMLTIAMCIALNRTGPLKNHIRGGLANGMTKEEIAEIILHAAIYCGVPAAAESTRIAMDTFKEMGV